MSDTPGADARQHRRFNVDVEATLIAADARKIPARTRDVSQTGICLVTAQGVTTGEIVQVVLVLAFGDNAFSEPLPLRARAVWSTNIAGAYQIGAMFHELDDNQAGYLELFLQYLDGTLAPKGNGAVRDDDDASPDDKDDPFK